MSKQKLLERLIASLATNHGVQPKQTEIWQRLKSLTPREVDKRGYAGLKLGEANFYSRFWKFAFWRYQRGSRNPCPPNARAFCLRYSA
jgi:hypothetical protein